MNQIDIHIHDNGLVQIHASNMTSIGLVRLKGIVDHLKAISESLRQDKPGASRGTRK